MVQAMIYIDDEVNRILNILKAQYGLRNKSEAIELVVHKYEETSLEPKLRPQYAKKLDKILKGKHYTQAEVERILGK